MKQTYNNIRVIIVDDGSVDKETIDIIAILKTKKNICVYSQKNKGVSVARNYGLSKSSGNYVYFLDSDDYIDETHISHLVDVAKKTKSDLVFAGKINEITKKNDAPFTRHLISLTDDSDAICIKSQAFTSQGVLIDGSIARRLSFTTTTTVGEDTEYITKAMTIGKTYFEGCGGYIYANNPNSITSQHSAHSMQRYLDESILLAKVFEKCLQVKPETISIFYWLKIIRISKRISLSLSYDAFKEMIDGHILKYSINKPKIMKLLSNNLLSMGEKIKILALCNHWYFVWYYVCNLRNHGKIKK